MPDSVRPGALVAYKNRPACVLSAGDKLEIELPDGEVVRVRPKDVLLLHPGPLRSVRELSRPGGPGREEIRAAWELLAGMRTTLSELAELIGGAFTSQSAWVAWQQVMEGLYFSGEPDALQVATREEVARKLDARAADLAEKQAWEAFLARVRSHHILPEDSHYLREVEELALRPERASRGPSGRSRLLRELGYDETPQNAHTLLLDLGYWDVLVNPYPRRLDIRTNVPGWILPPLPDEPRLDLTHLPAFAIDDAHTQTPDDAVSLDGDRLWVHVADAAALVPPGSPADGEAYTRGASVYLPEGTVHMLPFDATRRLGLGIPPVSPALSFGLDLDAEGRLASIQMALSWVRVTRLTYEEVQSRIGQEPFAGMLRLARRYSQRRQAAGAIFIELPEVDLRVENGRVSLWPVLPLDSRVLVEESMLMVGEAVARLSNERGIPVPFATQDPAEPHDPPRTLAEMYSLRRGLKRRQYRSVPAPHAGLGLEAYTQATSPLRRYLDLVVHQQLRAHLRGEPVASAASIAERIAAVDDMLGAVRQAESLSDRHWILVYLIQNGWEGEGVLVEKRGMTGTFLIPPLALEAQVHLPREVPLDSRLPLALTGVNLPHLEAHFRVRS